MDLPSSPFDPRAEELFLEWLAACDRGGAGDLDALCCAHPDLAPELRRLAAAIDWVNRLGPGQSLASLSARLRERFGSSAQLGSLEATPRGGDAAPDPRLEHLRAQGPRGTRYRVLDELGRGGMGAVLRVWDEDLRRTLAMKVNLADERRGDARVLKRFLEEAQITGQLDHPGIVPVHELGLDAAGRVYFTMKLVRGEDLKAVFEHVARGSAEWSRVRALSVLLRVCEAVAFAHSRGVVHRDLKPANVMVGKFGEVYVMDWGLARVLEREDKHDLRLHVSPDELQVMVSTRRESPRAGDGEVVSTMDGDVIGTPCFMAPEQARGELARIGPQSDVYSIGAMLYQLLAGRMPYVDGGPRPSATAVLARLLAGPPTSLRVLCPDGPPELIAICEKAMGREPNARYSDVEQLSSDLRAFLEGRVVAAYETGALAETRKWIRRNRSLAAALGGAFLILIVGIFVSQSQARRADAHARSESRALVTAREHADHAADSARSAQAARQQAETSAKVSREVLDFLNRDLLSAAKTLADAGSGIDVSMRSVLDTAARRVLDGRLADLPEAKARIHATLSGAYLSLGEVGLALEQCQASLPLFELALGPQHPESLEALSNLAALLEYSGELDHALCMYRQALGRFEQEGRIGSQAALDVQQNLAFLLETMGAYDEAERWYRGVLEARAQALGFDHSQTASVMNGLGSTLMAVERYAEAEALLDGALEIAWRTLGPSAELTLNAQNNLGGLYYYTDRFEECTLAWEQVYRTRLEIQGPRHPDYLTAANNVGLALLADGRPGQAAQYFRLAAVGLEEHFGPNHVEVARALHNLARSAHGCGEHDDACALFALAAQRRERAVGPNNPGTLRTIEYWADALEAAQRFSDAAGLRELLAQRLLETGDDAGAARCNHLRLAGVDRSRAGQHEEALARLAEARELSGASEERLSEVQGSVNEALSRAVAAQPQRDWIAQFLGGRP